MSPIDPIRNVYLTCSVYTKPSLRDRVILWWNTHKPLNVVQNILQPTPPRKRRFSEVVFDLNKAFFEKYHKPCIEQISAELSPYARYPGNQESGPDYITRQIGLFNGQFEPSVYTTLKADEAGHSIIKAFAKRFAVRNNQWEVHVLRSITIDENILNNPLGGNTSIEYAWIFSLENPFFTLRQFREILNRDGVKLDGCSTPTPGFQFLVYTTKKHEYDRKAGFPPAFSKLREELIKIGCRFLVLPNRITEYRWHVELSVHTK